MPSLDVFIPVYNYANLLPQCVESVLSQGLPEVRVVIIDNASSDNSVEVAQRLAASDSRIEVICHEKNVGSHASFNEAIDLATADYFMILCADDLLTPGSLRLGLEALEQNPCASFAIGAYAVPVPDKEPLEYPVQFGPAELVESQMYIDHCCRTVVLKVGAFALLVRTGIQKMAGHYCASISQLDDLEMVLRLAHYGPVVQLPAPMAIRRLHASNVSQALWNDRLFDLQERQAVFDTFFRNAGRHMPRAADLHRTALRRLGAWAYWSGLSHLARGQPAHAIKLFQFTWRLNPSALFIPPLGHLLRTEGSGSRLASVLKEALAGVH